MSANCFHKLVVLYKNVFERLDFLFTETNDYTQVLRQLREVQPGLLQRFKGCSRSIQLSAHFGQVQSDSVEDFTRRIARLSMPFPLPIYASVSVDSLIAGLACYGCVLELYVSTVEVCVSELFANTGILSSSLEAELQHMFISNGRAALTCWVHRACQLYGEGLVLLRDRKQLDEVHVDEDDRCAAFHF